MAQFSGAYRATRPWLRKALSPSSRVPPSEGSSCSHCSQARGWVLASGWTLALKEPKIGCFLWATAAKQWVFEMQCQLTNTQAPGRWAWGRQHSPFLSSAWGLFPRHLFGQTRGPLPDSRWLSLQGIWDGGCASMGVSGVRLWLQHSNRRIVPQPLMLQQFLQASDFLPASFAWG